MSKRSWSNRPKKQSVPATSNIRTACPVGVHSLEQHSEFWRNWARTHAPAEVKSKDVRAFAWLRALGPVVSAFLLAARQKGFIRLEDQPIIVGALERWEDVDFITRFAVLSTLSEIYDHVLGSASPRSTEVIALFARLYVEATTQEPATSFAARDKVVSNA